VYDLLCHCPVHVKMVCTVGFGTANIVICWLLRARFTVTSVVQSYIKGFFLFYWGSIKSVYSIEESCVGRGVGG
jgi:hypothetical protein